MGGGHELPLGDLLSRGYTGCPMERDDDETSEERAALRLLSESRGPIAECIVFNRALSDAEITALEAELNARWSIY